MKLLFENWRRYLTEAGTGVFYHVTTEDAWEKIQKDGKLASREEDGQHRIYAFDDLTTAKIYSQTSHEAGEGYKPGFARKGGELVILSLALPDDIERNQDDKIYDDLVREAAFIFHKDEPWSIPLEDVQNLGPVQSDEEEFDEDDYDDYDYF